MAEVTLLEWLREVDKLEKTADGVSIVLGMDVVTHMMTEGWQPNRVLGMFLREGVLWLDVGRGAKVQPCNCYSTREAAEAEGGDVMAKAKEKP